MHNALHATSRRSSVATLSSLRPAAGRLLLPALALHLLLPLAISPRAEATPGDVGSAATALSPGDPAGDRHDLRPGGPNSNRSRLQPGGPNSNRSRLRPSGPNSNRSRLGDLRPDDPAGARPDGRVGPGGEDARPFEWIAPDGFMTRIQGRLDDSGSYIASASLTSPEGEELRVEFLPAAEGGPVALIDGEILVSYKVTADGRVSSVLVDDGFRAVKSTRHRKPARSDNSAYGLLIEALAQRHSPEFLVASHQALSDLEGAAVAPATLRFVLECSLGVAGYIASIAGLVTGCTAGAAVTLGGSCALALFAHELAVASGVLACVK